MGQALRVLGRGELTVRTPETAAPQIPGQAPGRPCHASALIPGWRSSKHRWVVWKQSRDADIVPRIHLLCLVLGGRVLS